MPKHKSHRVGDLQFKIMQVLWQRAECGVSDVFADISKERDLAYTTIATMLRKMEVRGLVAHRADGRAFIYRVAIDSHTVTSSTSEHLIDRFFEGSLADLVSHLLDTREVSRAELAKTAFERTLFYNERMERSWCAPLHRKSRHFPMHIDRRQ